MSVTRNGNLLLVDRKSMTVYEYKMLSRNYRFSLQSKFGQDTLTDPVDCVQMVDGRVAVTDGKIGHSIKVQFSQNDPSTFHIQNH